VHLGGRKRSHPRPAVVQHFVRNVSRKHAMNAHLNPGCISRNLERAGSKAWMELSFTPRDSSPRFRPSNSLSPFLPRRGGSAGARRNLSGARPRRSGVPGASRAQTGLAQRIFQFANTQANGGLGAIQAFRSPRKAALLGTIRNTCNSPRSTVPLPLSIRRIIKSRIKINLNPQAPVCLPICGRLYGLPYVF